MLKLVVRISSMDEIQDFVQKCCKLDCDIDLKAGRYIVDAKSMMGVCSVDLTRDLQLHIYTENRELAEELLQEYVVKKIA